MNPTHRCVLFGLDAFGPQRVFFFNLTLEANFLKSKGFTQGCRLSSFSLKMDWSGNSDPTFCHLQPTGVKQHLLPTVRSQVSPVAGAALRPHIVPSSQLHPLTVPARLLRVFSSAIPVLDCRLNPHFTQELPRQTGSSVGSGLLTLLTPSALPGRW